YRQRRDLLATGRDREPRAGADRARPATDRGGGVWPLRILRRQDRRGAAERAALHEQLHRLSARERASRTVLWGELRPAPLGQGLRQAAGRSRRRDRYQPERLRDGHERVALSVAAPPAPYIPQARHGRRKSRRPSYLGGLSPRRGAAPGAL